jgi:hypothetical protein
LVETIRTIRRLGMADPMKDYPYVSEGTFRDADIEALPTEVDRKAAREIAAVLEPFSPSERRDLLNQALAHLGETLIGPAR